MASNAAAYSLAVAVKLRVNLISLAKPHTGKNKSSRNIYVIQQDTQYLMINFYS